MSVTPRLDVQQLRAAIQEEYADVATTPGKGFHFPPAVRSPRCSATIHPRRKHFPIT